MLYDYGVASTSVFLEDEGMSTSANVGAELDVPKHRVEQVPHRAMMKRTKERKTYGRDP